MRTCAGCGAKRPRSEMIRVAADKNGNVRVTGKISTPGRGAYICSRRACLEEARDKGGLRRGLRVNIPDAAFNELGLLIGSKRG
jgi:predicted RNA-binding protein YlxR (DUF448 family)